MNRVRIEVDGPVGYVVLARAEKKNALDRVAADEILAAVHQLSGDESVRVIALKADGPDFCAGADLSALAAMLDEPLAVHEADARALGNVFVALHTCAKPTLAIVRGRALAGGAGLAASCDMILAHEDAVIGYPEVRIGFVPAMAMAALLRWVPESVAFDLVATGRQVRADEALRLGLVSRCFAEAQMDDGVRELLRLLCAAPASAMSATRELLHELRGVPLAQGVAMGVSVNARARLGAEFRRGVLRYSSK
jgi:methylglutaconyl-CoA hydratase